MINIVASRSRNKHEYELSINGHAFYAENGNDIVCAGVSAIAYSLLGFLNNCQNVIDIDVIERSGELELICKGDNNNNIHTAFNMAVIGFLQIEKKYPKYVNVDVRF